MARRIIYLKNPSEGSHFRSIGGSGSSAPRSPKAPKAPKAPKLPKASPVPGPQDRDPNGYMPGYHTPTTWFIHTPGSPDFGNYDPSAPGTGPYDQQFTEFEPASTSLGFLYDLAMGIDPYTGNILPPLGTEGTLHFLAGTPWAAMAQEMEDTGFVPGNSQFYGYMAASAAHPGNPWPEIPSALRAKNPNRNAPRPWWASGTPSAGISFDMTMPGIFRNKKLHNAAGKFIPPPGWKPLGL